MTFQNPTRIKHYSFDARSFTIDESVEALLPQRDAIFLDFGGAAYINAEAIPLIISELIVNREATSKNKDEWGLQVGALKAQADVNNKKEMQMLIKEKANLQSEIQQYLIEISNLNAWIAISNKSVNNGKNENAKSDSGGAVDSIERPRSNKIDDSIIKASFEKLHKEFQELKHQNVETVTCLKVLEEENENLRGELNKAKDLLKKSSMNKTKEIVDLSISNVNV